MILNPTYSERDAMKELAQIVDGKYVVGSYQVGYGLYNNMLPVVTTPDEIVKMMEGDEEILLLDYEDKHAGMRNIPINVAVNISINIPLNISIDITINITINIA